MRDESKHYRVLVVDDDPVERFFLQRHLSTAGYDVRLAEDGAAGMRQMLDWRPHIVLCDWFMPGIDGLEVCRSVRAEPALEGVHLMMLTAHGNRPRLIEAFEAGVNDFLSKPVDVTELTARMHAGQRAVRLGQELNDRVMEAQRHTAELHALNERLQRMAITDELTGLFNRRHAVAKLNELWAAGGPVCVATLDVDRFKQVNDTAGHDAGDAVLREVAGAVTAAVGPSGIVCRTGGDEVLILMPGYAPARAADAADRCRRAVESRSVPWRGAALSVTVSLGLAARTPATTTPDDLLRQADQALLAAKNAGKNTTATAA